MTVLSNLSSIHRSNRVPVYEPKLIPKVSNLPWWSLPVHSLKKKFLQLSCQSLLCCHFRRHWYLLCLCALRNAELVWGDFRHFSSAKSYFIACMKNAYLSFLLHVYCNWEIFNLTVLAVWSDGTKIFWHMPQVTQHPWMEHLHLCDRVSSALAVAKPCSTWKFTLEINKNLTALSKSLRRIQQTLLCSCP